jgi:hypothetical protein
MYKNDSLSLAWCVLSTDTWVPAYIAELILYIVDISTRYVDPILWYSFTLYIRDAQSSYFFNI